MRRIGRYQRDEALDVDLEPVPLDEALGEFRACFPTKAVGDDHEKYLAFLEVRVHP